jgi:hypothetical protein
VGNWLIFDSGSEASRSRKPRSQLCSAIRSTEQTRRLQGWE